MLVLQPDGWPPPRGYSNGIRTRGDLIFVAGQVGWNAECVFESTDLVDQTRQALQNVRAVLDCGGAHPAHMTRMTWYVTDIASYRSKSREIGAVYREVLGRHFPTMTLVQVVALAEPEAVVEIEVTAVIPDTEDSPPPEGS